MLSLTQSQLCHHLDVIQCAGEVSQPFTSLALHSRQVLPQGLFFVISGVETQGALFIEEAVQRGALGLVMEKKDFEAYAKCYPTLLCLCVPDIRSALAHTASLFFPNSPPFRTAVTGTNGKTSVVHFTRQLWQRRGVQAASLGTLGLCVKEPLFSQMECPLPVGLNTPDPISLHHCFENLAAGGMTHCILEASSHGLHQKRLHGTDFQVGVWTNLSRDHLDYHVTMEAYRQAKEELFRTRLERGGVALLHADLPALSEIQALCAERQIQVWTYGGPHADLALLETRPAPTGQEVVIEWFGKKHTFFLPFCGRFQVENILASMGVVHASEIPLAQILEALPALTCVPGRLECVGQNQKGAAVYVDYAHTPHALQVALENIRAHTTGQLHVVFGCGGNRDGGKRPQMGAIAAQLADHVMVTDDNPRDEDPHFIRAQILTACPGAQEEGDRGVAIEKSLERLNPGDSLLIAGKGHETTQERGGEILPFCDRHVAQTLLARMRGEESES